MSAGKLHKAQKKLQWIASDDRSCKSDRSREDASAPIGMGATDTLGRIEASLFRGGPVAPEFSPCLDVPNGGVLLGIPALLNMGLLRHTNKYFQMPRGYYGLTSTFLLLAFMALARFKTIESCSAVTIKKLCRELNATKVEFPGTNLQLVYEMVS